MSPSSPAFSSCSVVSAASSSSSLPSSSFSFSSAGYNKLVECCILLGGLAFFGSSYLIFTNWWMTGCHVCPGRGSMTHPQRVVPGGSGITCGDLERIQSNCWDHRPLGKKFDLGAYCGCDGSEPPLNECTFDCPLQSGLVPPSVWPSKTSRGKSKPTHFDEILLLGTTLAPTERPSANDESEPSDSAVSSSNGLFDADIMMCNDVSTVVPFIKDQGFCMEVQEFCCPAITTMAQTAPMEIPSACMMCENGRQVLEEKLLPGDENEHTCGEVSRFYEHMSNVVFCEKSVPLLREHCCTEGNTTKTSHLEVDPVSPASTNTVGVHWTVLFNCAAAVVIYFGLMTDTGPDDVYKTHSLLYH